MNVVQSNRSLIVNRRIILPTFAVLLLIANFTGRQFRSQAPLALGSRATLRVELAPPDAQIVSMADNAFVDVSEERPDKSWLIEGWLTSKQSVPVLFVRSDYEAIVVSPYLFERPDLAGIPNATGFGFVLKARPVEDVAPCVLNKKGKYFRHLSGSSC